MRRLLLALSLFVTIGGATVRAQAPHAGPASPNDSLFLRARRLVAEGNGVAGRALVDTLLRQASEGTTAYGDALYWRGALAETAAEAERDYRRVIVEYALSPYADDALLAIAELEQARGDRAGALQHLQRFVREHGPSAARGTAALSAARLAFDQRDTRLACAMLMEARASVTAADVELRNQLDYFNGRCPVDMQPVPVSPAPQLPPPASVSPAPTPARAPDTTRVATPIVAPPVTRAPVSRANDAPPTRVTKRVKADTVVRNPGVRATTRTATATAKTDVAAPASTPAPAKPVAARAGTYTIQLAAYNTVADAQRLVKKLAAKGVAARISGTAKPFRVRLGFYATRQAAADEVAALKARGIISFVTTEARSSERATP